MEKTCRLCERLGRLCLWPYLAASWLLRLLFLPEAARKWIFGTGTRALEIINALLLLGWAGVMLSDTGNIYLLHSYTKFAELPGAFVFGLFGGVGLLLLVFLPSEHPRANIISGFLLVAAGLLWALVSTGFAYSYPPFTPTMIVYPVIAALSWWAGINLVDTAKAEMGKVRGE